MDREELVDQIISAFEGEEWEMLDSGSPDLPVTDFCRETLLELMNPYREFEGEIDGDKVEELYQAMTAYLQETQPENAEAYRFITWASIIRTFLDDLPIHSEEEVGYLTNIDDGEREYCCPRKGSDAMCGLCVAGSCEPLYRKWEAAVAETESRFGERSALIQKYIFELGFLNSGVIKTSELNYHEDLRQYCRENRCHNYNASWACPPAVGKVEECRERVNGFEYMQLFSKAYFLPDAYDMAAMQPAVADFKDKAIELNKKLNAVQNGMMILSNDSCKLCEKCNYPDAPCEHPLTLHHTIEGYGFYIYELARQAGIPYSNGGDTVTLFGGVLYDEGAVGDLIMGTV